MLYEVITVSIGGERGFRPGAVEGERARPFRREGEALPGMDGVQDGDHALGGRLLGIRHMRGHTAGADADALQRLALFRRQAGGLVVAAQVHRSAAFQYTEGEPARQAFQRLVV